MGGAAHSFVWLPPRLNAETATTAASSGGPAGPPPRLRARRQACTATRDDNEDYDRVGPKSEQQDAPAAGGRRHNYQRSLDGG